MPNSVAHPVRAAAALVLVAAAASAATLPAQVTSVPTASPAEECLGLTFGAWTPPLDAAAAGHGKAGALVDTNRLSSAVGNRDWALRLEAGRDTTLILFPSWWPVGVAVRVPARTAIGGDSLRGTATALVADARAQPPTAPVVLSRVPCRAP